MLPSKLRRYHGMSGKPRTADFAYPCIHVATPRAQMNADPELKP